MGTAELKLPKAAAVFAEVNAGFTISNSGAV
jgi:hypothetical protein